MNFIHWERWSKSLRPFSPENGAESFTQTLQYKQGIKPCTTEMEVIDMAKDGTYRGGRRVKAGSKPDALADKIMKGAPAKRIGLPNFTEDMTDFDVDDIGDGVEPEGMDMPSPDDYLSALQEDGKPLGADEIYKETWLWLKECGCERLVNKRLPGKHPTTGAAIASPFTQLLMNFQKQAEKEQSEVDSHHREEAMNKIKELQDFIAGQETDITEFDEALVKKLIEKITVFADHFTVEFKSGIIIDIEA